MAKNPHGVAKRPLRKETTFGDEIVHGLTDFFDAVERGETITVRTLKLDLEPSNYTAQDVAKTRRKLRVSQSIFATLLAVKVKTVQAWEQGVQPPSGTARRLLDEMNQNPKRWIEKLKQRLTEKAR